MVSRNDAPSKIDVSFYIPGESEADGARDRLLQKISDGADLPALGGSVSRVVQLASSDDEAMRELANFILSDVTLTQKILRVANTVCYRATAGTSVTTVSKAIMLLGFDTVKAAALTVLLVDGMPAENADSVRKELAHSLAASIVGREMARRSTFKDAEEATVAALFKNVGRLLVAAYDHEQYSKIVQMVESGRHTPSQAAMKVLGCSFDLLAESVLREWKIPLPIIKSLAPLPAGMLKPAQGKQEWLQQVASFGTAVASLIQQKGEPGYEAAVKSLLARFGAALDIDQAKLSELFGIVIRETEALVTNINFPPEELVEEATAEPAPAEKKLPSELLLDRGGDAAPLQPSARHPSGKPFNAGELLLTGVQDVTQLLVSGRCKVSDLMLLVLETLYSGMGFRFAAVCMHDVQTKQFRARITMGENNEARRTGFVFPAASASDLFHLALDNEADLLIADTSAPNIRDLLPAWHRALLPDARSLIVLPLIVNQKQVGLFYADRARPAPEGVSPEETALIKALKGQIVAALTRARSGE